MTMNVRAFRSLCFALVALFTLTACGDYSVRLPGGYSLVRVYGGAVLIAGDHVRGVVIDPNIDSYKVLGDIVIGHVNMPDGLTAEDKAASKPGYFILDTKTHDVKQGLDKNAWLDALRAQGVSTEPSLSKPSRFDKNY